MIIKVIETFNIVESISSSVNSFQQSSESASVSNGIHETAIVAFRATSLTIDIPAQEGIIIIPNSAWKIGNSLFFFLKIQTFIVFIR